MNFVNLYQKLQKEEIADQFKKEKDLLKSKTLGIGGPDIDLQIAKKVFLSFANKKKEKLVIKKEEEHDNDLFDLVGCIKESNKRQLDYEEVQDEVEQINYEVNQETLKEKMENDDAQPSKIENLLSNTIDWRGASHYFQRYVLGCFILFFLSWMSLISGIAYYEYDYRLSYADTYVNQTNSTDPNEDTVENLIVKQRTEINQLRSNYDMVRKIALVAILFLTLLSEFTLVTIQAEYVDWQKKIKQMNKEETVLKARNVKGFLFNLFLALIQPYLFINDVEFNLKRGSSSNPAKVNYLLFCGFVVIRYWYIIKFLIISSYYYSPRMQRFSAMYQTELNLSFAMKCILKSHPLICLIIMFLSNICMGGYMIRIWERYGNPLPSASFDSYENCIWYAFITMCTVGYGDFFAGSSVGRLVVCFVAVSGVFIMSTLTVVMTDNFTFEGGELKAFNMLWQIELNEQLDLIRKKLFAKCFLINHVRIRLIKAFNRKAKQNVINNIIYQEKIVVEQRNDLLKKIREMKEEIRTSFKTDAIDVLTDKITDIKKGVVKIKETLDEFDGVLEISQENQRSLDVLKNQIWAIKDDDFFTGVKNL